MVGRLDKTPKNKKYANYLIKAQTFAGGGYFSEYFASTNFHGFRGSLLLSKNAWDWILVDFFFPFSVFLFSLNIYLGCEAKTCMAFLIFLVMQFLISCSYFVKKQQLFDNTRNHRPICFYILQNNFQTLL